jgi:hypothetical protein
MQGKAKAKKNFRPVDDFDDMLAAFRAQDVRSTITTTATTTTTICTTK